MRGVLLSGTLLSMMVLSCSSSLTVDEHADWCAAQEQPDPSEITTWGEFAEFTDSLIEETEAITPPDVLQTYHRRLLDTFRTMRGLAGEHQADDTPDGNDFLDLGLLTAAGALIDAREALPPDVQDRLIERGCFDPDE